MLARFESRSANRPQTADVFQDKRVRERGKRRYRGSAPGEREETDLLKERLYTARTLHDPAPRLSNLGCVDLEIGGILRSPSEGRVVVWVESNIDNAYPVG